MPPPTMSLQKIRLPSINDIFPQQQPQAPRHHGHPGPVSPPPAPSQHQHQHQHQQRAQNHPQLHVQVQATSPLPLQHQQFHEVHSPQPVYYYYQPVYYAPGPNPSPPMMGYNYTHAHAPQHQAQHQHQPRFSTRITKHRQSNAWTDEDDTLLRYLKDERNLGWREISLHFRDRTANGCQFRWRRISALARAVKGEKEESDEEERAVESKMHGVECAEKKSALKMLLN